MSSVRSSRSSSFDQSFDYVPLQRAIGDSGHESYKGFRWLHQGMMGLFLLERLQLKNFVVWVATYHYVPLLACILAIWMNCTLHLFFSFVFPALREKYHWSMYSWRDVKEIPRAHDALLALCIVLAHIGMLLGIAVIGYKLMCVVTDALMDSCVVTYDEVAGCTVGFPRLLRDCQTVLTIRHGRFIAITIAATISLLLFCIFSSDTLVRWERESGDIFCMFTAVILVLVVTMTVDFHRRVRHPIGTSMVRWWRKAVPRARRFYVCVLAIYCLHLSQRRGTKYGVASFCEGMLYVNTLHVVLLVATRVTRFFHDLAQLSVALLRNPTGQWPSWWYVTSVIALIALSAAYFSFTLIIVHFILLLFLLSGTFVRHGRRQSVKHLQQRHSQHEEEIQKEHKSFEHYVRSRSENDMHSSSYSSTSPAHRTVKAEKARIENTNTSTKSTMTAQTNKKKRKGSATPWIHHGRSPGLLFRAFHRVTFFLAFLLTLSLALWVSVKHPGLEGITPTRCEGDEMGERIRVTARYMTADLYGLRDYEDPRKLVYEADEAKYDAVRHDGLCSKLWPGGLHAADLAYFSLMAYLQRNSTDFVTMLDFYKRYRDGATDWVALPTNHTYGKAVFRHLYSPSKNTSVIAVRGTDITSPFDLLQNILLFCETAVFKILANLLPLSSLIPERVIVDYVAASSSISSSLLGGDTADYYHLHVEDYVDTVKSKHVIVTGHSLGGVVAHIVAAHKNIPGVAFSSPGINLMRKKLRIDPDAIDALTTNVIVSNDFTVTIDTPGGTVHHIQCEHKTAEVCHSIELHTIRMWTVCPSYRSMTRLNGTYKLNE